MFEEKPESWEEFEKAMPGYMKKYGIVTPATGSIQKLSKYIYDIKSRMNSYPNNAYRQEMKRIGRLLYDREEKNMV